MLGIPSHKAQGETELIGKLFERVASRVFRVGRANGWIPMGVDDGRIWDTIMDDEHDIFCWMIHFLDLGMVFTRMIQTFFVHSDGEGRTRTWYNQVLEGVHSQQDIPGHWKKRICDLLAFIETCKGNQGVFFILVMNPKPSSNFLIRMGCLNNHPSRNYPLVN